jgi:glycosyltransferase involved in cell wall biosynthesis
MQWFYGQMDFVYAPSEYYRQHLIELGFKRQQLGLLDHGVDLELFCPSRREPDYWKKHGLEDGFHFIYVGRVSREKNLEVLLESFRSLRARVAGVNLMIVGDGPLLPSLREHYANCGVIFTGWLQGEELAKAYASSDALVFPSTTDTFGNVVLEAHACGLPAIVSHRGGPQEIVSRNESGIVVNTSHPGALTDAMAALCRSTNLADLQARALRTARGSSWQMVLESFWNESSREATAMAAELPVPSSLELDDTPLALDLA